jgi:hypothetical protein
MRGGGGRVRNKALQVRSRSHFPFQWYQTEDSQQPPQIPEAATLVTVLTVLLYLQLRRRSRGDKCLVRERRGRGHEEKGDSGAEHGKTVDGLQSLICVVIVRHKTRRRRCVRCVWLGFANFQMKEQARLTNRNRCEI